jgi:hypothetical protein
MPNEYFEKACVAGVSCAVAGGTAVAFAQIFVMILCVTATMNPLDVVKVGL